MNLADYNLGSWLGFDSLVVENICQPASIRKSTRR